MREAHYDFKKRGRLKKNNNCPLTLLLNDRWSDHLIERVVFAFTGWCNVHCGGADILLLEASLEQMRSLCLL